MRKCPFCAEDIQDAAIVCKHCGRDITPKADPPAIRQSRANRRWPIAVVVTLVIGLTIVRALFRQDVESSRNCTLHARAAIITRDAPIAQALNWNTDVLAIRSADAADWVNVEVTIWGFVNTPVTGRQPTGPYSQKRRVVSARELIALNLNEFQKPSGDRWISLTMNVEDIRLKASVRGASCEIEISPRESTDLRAR